MRIITLLIAGFVLFQQCDSKQNTGQQDPTTEEVTSNQEGSTAPQEPLPIESASSGFTPNTDTLEDGTVVHKATPLGPIGTGIWVYDGELNTKSDQPQTKGNGRWLKFETDMTFSYGQYDQRLRNGKWNFLEDKNIIELTYDDEPNKMLGFEIQSNGDAMVLKGLGRYSTNGIMTRVSRKQAYPKQ